MGGKIVVALSGIVLLLICILFFYGFHHASFIAPDECCGKNPPITGSNLMVTGTGGTPVDISHNVTAMYEKGRNEALLSFPQNLSDPYEASYVPMDTARRHASIGIARMLYTDEFGSVAPDFSGAQFDPDPTIIFDEITGKRTFYEFHAGGSDSNGTFILIAASKFQGFSSPQEGLRSPSAETIPLQKAQGYYNANFSGYTINSAKFVTGCWGKIVQLNLTRPGTAESEIVNMDYWRIVPERRCGASTDEIPKKEIPARINAWNESDAMYQGIFTRAQKEGINFTEPYSIGNTEKMKQFFALFG